MRLLILVQFLLPLIEAPQAVQCPLWVGMQKSCVPQIFILSLMVAVSLSGKNHLHVVAFS